MGRRAARRTRGAVALERVLARLRLLRGVDVLHRDAAVHRAHGVALAVVGRGEAARLRLERRLAPLERLGEVARVEDEHVPAGRADDDEGQALALGDGHRVHLVWLLVHALAAARAPHVPQPQRAVPAAAHEPAAGQRLDRADGAVVQPEAAVRARRPIVVPELAVDARRDDGRAAVEHGRVEHGGAVRVPPAQLVGRRVVEVDVAVPRGGDQRARGGEAQFADRIGRRVAQQDAGLQRAAGQEHR